MELCLIPCIREWIIVDNDSKSEAVFDVSWDSKVKADVQIV